MEDNQSPQARPTDGGSGLGGQHHYKQVCGIEMGEKEKQSSLSIVKRDRTGDMRMERNSLLGVASPVLEAMVKFQSQLLLRAIAWIHSHGVVGISINV